MKQQMIWSWPILLACSLILLASVADARAAQPESRDLVEVGWHDGFDANYGWRAEPWQMSRPDEKATTTFGPQGARFEVATPQHTSAWTRTTNPIWVQPFSTLEVEYACSGSFAPGFPQLLLTDDSTGPITPNALNPENPQAGEHEIIIQLPTNETAQIIDLRGKYPSDRVARISLRLSAGDEPASLTMKRLVFRTAASSSPATQPALLAVGAADAAGSIAAGTSWQPVMLPEQGTVPAAALADALNVAPHWPGASRYRAGGIEFQLRDADRAALATGIVEEEPLHVAGPWKGSELGLLLAARVYGNAAPWYSPASLRERTTIESPHQFVVQLEYEDGTTVSHFPWSLEHSAYRIGPSPAAHVVPLEPGRHLVRFSLVDRMSYGQVFLLAAAVNTSKNRIRPPDVGLTSTPAPEAQPRPDQGRHTIWSHSQTGVTVENSEMKIALDLAEGPRITQMALRPSNRTIITGAPACFLAEVQDDRGTPLPLTLREHNMLRIPDGVEITATWAVGDAADQRTLRMLVRIREQGTIEIRSTLQNQEADTWNAVLASPVLRGVTIASDPAQAGYLIGTRNAALGCGDASIQHSHGAVWPLPLVDLFDARDGGGLGVMIDDPQLLAKSVAFTQKSGKADLTLRFTHVTVPAGGQLKLPQVLMLAHQDDWRVLFEHYRAQARRGFQPPARLSDTFYCRRDYPLGGTDYLFDVSLRKYTPQRLIAESTRAFGGIDMIDISGWAFHEKTGRVGDYLTNDLGGLDAVRELAEQVRATNRKIGLYFEGFLIDKRCPLAEKALPAWQLIQKDGKPRWWPGEMEFFTCPGVKAWQQELGRTIATVAKQTGVDAVYVDQFGQSTMDRACWSADHGHPVPSNPLQDERDMLQTIRAALAAESLETAVYIEFVPAAGLMGLVDSAFDLGMSYSSPHLHPTKLPLYRYVFPELATFEMMSHGIRPVPFEVDDLHRAVFHGLGLWLKGRAESWFTRDFRDLAVRAHPVFANHADVLRSPDCEPLIPTLQPNVYANRFTAGGKTIYTVYNANYSTVSGNLLMIPITAGRTVTELLDPHSEVMLANDVRGRIIQGRVEPWSVAVYLVE